VFGLNRLNVYAPDVYDLPAVGRDQLLRRRSACESRVRVVPTTIRKSPLSRILRRAISFASLKVSQTRHPRCDERVTLRECPLIRAAQFLYDTCPGLPTSR
jgi:hypothetical protein